MASTGAKRSRATNEDHYTPDNRGANQPRRAVLELDESIVAIYHMFIHPVLPILPGTFAEIRSYLNSLSPATGQALIAALECAVGGAHFTGDEVIVQVPASRAQELLSGSRVDANNPAQAQALLLLAIEADNRGMATYKAGEDSGEYLNRAVKLAERLDVRVLTQNDRLGFSPNISVAITLAMMHVMEQLSTRKDDADALRLFELPMPFANQDQVSTQVYWMSSTSTLVPGSAVH
jgi:hypothetical protein